MTDDNVRDHTLELLRRMDGKLDRVLAELADLKPRMTAVEEAVARQSGRIDRIDFRLDRIERRLDLTEEAAP